MKLVFGLGNPGKRFFGTRHNTGAFVVSKFVEDSFSDSLKTVKKYKSDVYYKAKEKVLFCNPKTFMNNSGSVVSLLKRQHKVGVSDIFVVYDDLDIKLGEFKIVRGKSPKDHNGILSIIEKIGTSDFWHIRMGIENRNSNENISGEDYVLMKFPQAEQKIIDSTYIRLKDELQKVLEFN